jgi:hypothetical protein
MKRNLLFRKVKDDGVSTETFIEHAAKTYHVGMFLFNKLSLKLEKEKFLYCCLFHDVGKLVVELGKGPHSTKSREGFELIKKTKEYAALLRNFELEDYSEDEDVVSAIERHHDSGDPLGAFVSISDQIASSSSNEDLKNRLRDRPISSLITYLNERHDFHKFNFYTLSIPSFSKNELNVVGKLLLLKLLFETIDSLLDMDLLYDTLDGCRVVTMLDKEEFISRVSRQFNSNFVHFFENQPIDELLGGAPDGFKQYTTFPEEIRKKLTGLTVEKYKKDILRSLKRRKIENLADVGIDDGILYSLAALPELRNFYSNIRGTKYALLCDRDGKYSEWVASTFDIKGKKKEIVKDNKPIIEELLEKAGADISKITNKDVLYSKLFTLVVAVNSLNSSEVCFDFDILPFLKVDGVVPLGQIAVKNVCANCGTFEGRIPLETFTYGYRQHFRESLFTETNSSIRKGKIFVCSLCHAEGLLNVALCGVTIQNQRTRINTKTHLVLYGLDIGRDLLEELTDRELIDRLSRDCNIMRENVYVRDKRDLQIFFYSLEEHDVGIKNKFYRDLLFSLIATRLKERNPLLLAFCINVLPKYLDNSVLQFPEGTSNIIEGGILDFFYYVYCDVSTSPDRKRDYVLQYCNRPLIGVAQILRREKIRYDERTEKVVMKLKKDDLLFELMDEIWEMAKIGGALETRKNVGSFLGVFKGKPEDLDRIVNRFMKNEKLSSEQRDKIIEKHSKLREEFRGLDEDTRKNLKEYAQKTKYLFNSKKFHEIRKESDQK